MIISNHSALPHAIAIEKNRRVINIEEYDPNVCRFTVHAAHGWKPFTLEGYPFSQEARFSYAGRKVAANEEWIRVKVEGI